MLYPSIDWMTVPWATKWRLRELCLLLAHCHDARTWSCGGPSFSSSQGQQP